MLSLLFYSSGGRERWITVLGRANSASAACAIGHDWALSILPLKLLWMKSVQQGQALQMVVNITGFSQISLSSHLSTPDFHNIFL